MKINGDKSGEGRDPIVTSLSVTENGTYSPSLGVDGFNPVVVDVPTGGIDEKDIAERNFNIVNLSNSASFVAPYAFYNDQTIQTAYLPECKFLYQACFANCPILSEITLPGSEVTLMDSMDVFAGCYNLQNIYVPLSLLSTYQNTYPWYYSSELLTPIEGWPDFMWDPNNSIVSGWASTMGPSYLDVLGISANDPVEVLMSKLQSVESSTFMNHVNLKGFNLGMVSSYPDDLFNGCGIYELGLYNPCGDRVFANNPTLSIVYVNDTGSVIPIGTGVFDNHDSNNFAISVPFSLYDDYLSASGWSEYASYIYTEEPFVYLKNGWLKGTAQYVAPDTITAYGISGYDVMGVSLPSLQYIYQGAFAECPNLAEIYLLNNYCNLAYDEWYDYSDGLSGATSLQSIYIPWENMQLYINDYAWAHHSSQFVGYGNSNPVSVENGILIASSHASILEVSNLNSAVSDPTSVYGIDLPYIQGLEGEAMFQSYSNVSFANMGGLWNVTSSTFKDCTSLLNVNLDTATRIDDYAFYNCTSLSEVDLGYELAVVVLRGDSVFSGCTNLTTIRVPANMVSDYQTSPFWASYSSLIKPGGSLYFDNGWLLGNISTTLSSRALSSFLTEQGLSKTDILGISLPKKPNGDSALFASCYNLVSINMPVCDNISGGCFRYCSSLKDVSLPECTRISANAFANCSTLETISLPMVSFLSSTVFSGDWALKEVYLMSNEMVSLANFNCFSDCPALTSIYVPMSLLTDYQNDGQWGYFSNLFVGV